MLKERILSAIVMIAIVLITLFYFPPLWFVCGVACVVIAAIWEWTGFAELKQAFTRGLTTFLTGIFIFVYIYANSGYISAGNILNNQTEFLLMFSLPWWLIALFLVITYPKSAKFWRKSFIAHAIFATMSLIPFALALIALRFDNYNIDQTHGLVLLLYVFILVWSADSGAYFVGRAFGKHKLAPQVSPGKTWQGAIGGVVTATLTAFIFLQFEPLYQYKAGLGLLQFILISVATVAISILGDLTESMFKREANLKDSSHLIPGHGGILDRIDSLTAALPLFTLFYLILS
ncbi:phosphatidate cytidylyltransferase [Mergibacter septicus]|uniref:phosphatidate cytidylyltransferase n=1 Tax=Mergibacter septicus TaxID=221402 RepID=UPI0011794FC0|nr:phosphatidate cytidylyltransferase [Mergibacter septicus]AWX13850.1 phosphatidate cytidylyltransferase [Mergibacter septicus]